MADRLTPANAIGMWLETPGSELDRVVRYANKLADHYLREKTVNTARIPLQDLNLSTLAYGSLRRAGYQFVDEIKDLSIKDLQAIRNIGPQSAVAIKLALNRVYLARM